MSFIWRPRHLKRRICAYTNRRKESGFGDDRIGADLPSWPWPLDAWSCVSEQAWWKTAVVLCIFVTLLVTVQFLSVKFDTAEKLFLGKATVVIKNEKSSPKA